MNIYRSKSSWLVKLATAGALISVILIILTLITIDNNFGIIGGAFLGILVLGSVIYFYANSLNTIILEDDKIVL